MCEKEIIWCQFKTFWCENEIYNTYKFCAKTLLFCAKNRIIWCENFGAKKRLIGANSKFVQERNLCLTNLPMRSVTVRITRPTVGTTPNVQSNPRILVFWKKSFFSFFGAQKVHFLRFLGVLTNLFDPHTFLASKLMVLRGSVF